MLNFKPPITYHKIMGLNIKRAEVWLEKIRELKKEASQYRLAHHVPRVTSVGTIKIEDIDFHMYLIALIMAENDLLFKLNRKRTNHANSSKF